MNKFLIKDDQKGLNLEILNVGRIFLISARKSFELPKYYIRIQFIVKDLNRHPSADDTFYTLNIINKRFQPSDYFLMDNFITAYNDFKIRSKGSRGFKKCVRAFESLLSDSEKLLLEVGGA